MTILPTRLRSPLSLADAAQEYAAAGFAVFPCQPRGKKPLHSKSAGAAGYKDATRDREIIRRWWEATPTANIGIVPASANLIVLDIDGEEGERAAARLRLDECETATVRTSRGRHLWFMHPGGRIGNRALHPKIDVRADAGYVLAPPSVHPDGPVYEWLPGVEGFAELPAHIIELLTGSVGEGSRNNSLASHLGGLRRRGAEFDELLEAGREFNSKLCDPPLEEKEVVAVVRSIVRYPVETAAWEARIEEVNRRYALVRTGGKMRILYETGMGFVLMSREDFNLRLANEFVPHGDRRVPLSKVWIESPARREFDEIVFAPGAPPNPRVYNIWKGWGVEPRPGDFSLFEAHIRDVICNGDAKLARWVMAWMAQIFRDPMVKPGTALALRGKQGTGKTIVGKILGRLLGEAYRHVSSPRMVVGQFNHHLEACLMLHADEAFWAGDKSAEGVLKDMVTNDRQWIERKGIDQIETQNLLRLLVTSNSSWVVPAGMEERRFCVIDVSERRMQDHQYFADLMRQMESGGYSALLHHFLNADYSDVNLRQVPVTHALVEQKLNTLSVDESWLLDLLNEGQLPGDMDGDGIVERAALYDDYIKRAQKRGVNRRSAQTQLGMLLSRLLPGVKPKDLADRGAGRTRACYVFPPLQKARAQFLKQLPGLELALKETWNDSDEWKPSGEPGDEHLS